MTVRVGNGEWGLGCSPYTLDVKLKQFPVILEKFLAIYRNLLRRHGGEVVVLDLTAGAGRYEYAGQTVEGMVVQALELLAASGLPWRLCAIESNQAHYERLAASAGRPYGILPGGSEPLLLLKGACATLAPAFLDGLVPAYRCMLIVYDWNGAPDLVTVGNLLRHPRAAYADALGHIQAVAVKRIQGVHTGPIRAKDPRKLYTQLDALPRRRQLLRRISGKLQWTYVISTNASDLGSFLALGFFERGTPRGEWMREMISFSEKELAAGAALAGSGRPVQIALPLTLTPRRRAPHDPVR